MARSRNSALLVAAAMVVGIAGLSLWWRPAWIGVGQGENGAAAPAGVEAPRAEARPEPTGAPVGPRSPPVPRAPVAPLERPAPRPSATHSLLAGCYTVSDAYTV